jgi:hypothetical protein
MGGNSSTSAELARDRRLIGAIALFVFLAHLLVSSRYGYFVDELYYLACSHHLAWGYVDQPPLIAVITWLERVVLGDSLSALHFLPAVAAGLRVVLTGYLARELGARRFAIALSCVCVAVAPLYLGLDSLLTMNVFESLFWMGGALVALKIFNGGDPRLWILFGVISGIGLLNKHSMLFFGFGLAAGLLLTKQRKQLDNAWIWLGALIALVIFLPNLIWEIQHHFPTIELLQNVQRSGRNTEMNPFLFTLVQMCIMHPLAAPVWIAGLVLLLRDPEEKGWRVLGITYLVIMLCMFVLHGRIYYPGPAYPMLFAAGGVAVDRWLSRLESERWLKPAYIALLVVTGVLLAPFAYFPLLSVNEYLAYAKFMHLQPVRLENHEMGPLPQIYADQFGWKEMAQVVADAYHQLPQEEQKGCGIFGQNYGQAGAIDFFGAKLGLPPAISGHQNYFYWGPRGFTGKCMIVLGDTSEQLGELFESVEKVGTVNHPLSMPYQHFEVYLCRGPKFGTIEAIWSQLKRWG